MNRIRAHRVNLASANHLGKKLITQRISQAAAVPTAGL
jgi:hypothetical protein